MKILLVILALSGRGSRPYPCATKASTHVVKMEGMKFTPKTLDIKVGDKVQWVNASHHSHNVVANNGSFKSKMLYEQGQVFEFTFTTAGSFAYYCQPHKLMGMKGLIVVK